MKPASVLGRAWIGRFAVVGIFVAIAASLPAREEAAEFGRDEIHHAQVMLDELRQVVKDYHYPNGGVGKEFDARCAEAGKALEAVHSNGEAFGVIADALSSPDPRIRFYPPMRQVRPDYGWDWKLIGNDIYVVEVDHVGEAHKQGLKVGDRILSCDGITITRENYDSVNYVLYTLAPRPGLQVVAQSPGEAPRELALATTVRPQRRLLTTGTRSSFWTTFELSKTDKRHRDEFFDLKAHLHRVGPVAVWRAIELQHDAAAVGSGLKEIASARSLILDLRGIAVGKEEPAMKMLDGLFAEKATFGVIKRGNLSMADVNMTEGGGSSAFHGLVLVLIDADTAGYAEVMVRAMQMKQRAVIMGDYTRGRAIDSVLFYQTRGAIFSFSTAGVVVPTGDIVMADGVQLDSKGVAPDFLLRPTGADLAANRDVVLAKALSMLKQKVTPEEAHQIVHLPSEDDDDN